MPNEFWHATYEGEFREDWEDFALGQAAPIAGTGDNEGAEDLFRVLFFGC